MMAMLKTWEDARTEDARAHLSERDLARLKRWLEKAFVAGSVSESIEDPS